MTHSLRTLTGIIAILWYTASAATSPAVVPYYCIRSQGLNTPRQLVGLIQKEYATSRTGLYGTVASTLEYSRSFNSQHVVESLFGAQNCKNQTITISGSRIPNRGATDWLADYLYLPTDFKSTVQFKPVIDNVTLDFLFFVGLDDWISGLYMGIYSPLVHTRWNLNLCETIDLPGTNTMVPGYFTPATLPRNDLLNDFSEYISGQLVGPVVQTVGGTDYTITFNQLRNARMSLCNLTRTRFADVRIEIGYEFVKQKRYGVGFAGQVVAPAGNKPHGEYLFEPVVGNGNSWEFGASLNGYAKAWCSENEKHQVIFYLNALATHVFGARQKRTFDFKGKPFSRYMLLERLNAPVVDNLKGDGTKPLAQFFNEFSPAANLTRLSVDVSSGVQAEVTALATFVCNAFSWDIGYNFWFRSCENVKLRGINPGENNITWAIKGDAMVFGFDRGALSDALVGAVPLSSTESNATMYQGTNFTADTTFAQGITNPNIDNPENATGDASGGSANNPLSAQPNTTTTQIKTSIDPVFLNGTSINLCEGLTRGLSNKVFTHVSYQWRNHEHWVPYLGIGGEVEFAQGPSDCDECTTCIPCGVSQWGVWIKGGLSY